MDFGECVQEGGRDGKPALIAVYMFGWGKFSGEEKVRQTLCRVDKLKVGDVVLVWWEGESIKYGVRKVIGGNKKTGYW